LSQSTLPQISMAEIRQMIGHACDFVSLTPEERQTALACIEKAEAEDRQVSIEAVFREEALVQEADLTLVTVFDRHLETVCLDREFGQLAVANDLISPGDLHSARQTQASQFEKYRISLLLGDILEEAGQLSRDGHLSVLLTQGRITDQALEEAFGELGMDPVRHPLVNKRFCAMAIKSGLAGIDQVNEALGSAGNGFIGPILRNAAQIREQDYARLLEDFRQVEKRRLDLEQALYPLQAQDKICRKLGRQLMSRISPDGTRAWVKRLGEDPLKIPAYALLIWLRRVGIRSGIVGDSALEEFLASGKKGAWTEVATGIPPVPGQDGGVEFLFAPTGDNADSDQANDPHAPPPESTATDGPREETAEEDGDTPSEEPAAGYETETEEGPADNGDPKDTGNPDTTVPEDVAPPHVTVEKGTLLARIIPGEPGRPGRDVAGNPIPPPPPAQGRLQAGPGVIIRENEFFAAIPGRPEIKNQTMLSVIPEARAPGPCSLDNTLGSDTGNQFQGKSVVMTGDILVNGVLHCHDLVITGRLLGNAFCTGRVELRGRVGPEKAPEAEDALYPAGILSKGSVTLTRDAAHARIRTQGRIMAFNVAVRGCELTAWLGMAVRDVLGSDSGPSVLRFGLAPDHRLISVDQTLETRTRELARLTRVAETDRLTRAYETDLATAEQHALEQAILMNLKEVIDAPELFQHPSLPAKLRYLKGLPEFSGVRRAYLRLPETDGEILFLNNLLEQTAGLPVDDVLAAIVKQTDPEAMDEHSATSVFGVTQKFRADMEALAQEMETDAQRIETLEKEIAGLTQLQVKLAHTAPAPPQAEARVRNRCEKGTIIKGRLARRVMDKDVHNVVFREMTDPGTGTAVITLSD